MSAKVSKLLILDELENYLRGFEGFKKLVLALKNGERKGFGYVYFRGDAPIEEIVGKPHQIRGKLFRIKKIVSQRSRNYIKNKEIQCKVFVTQLGKRITEIDLQKYFSKYGEILDILVNRDKFSGKSKGYGFILFSNELSSNYMINQNSNHFIQEQHVICKPCHEKYHVRKKKIYNSKHQTVEITSFNITTQSRVNSGLEGQQLEQANFGNAIISHQHNLSSNDFGNRRSPIDHTTFNNLSNGRRIEWLDKNARKERLNSVLKRCVSINSKHRAGGRVCVRK